MKPSFFTLLVLLLIIASSTIIVTFTEANIRNLEPGELLINVVVNEGTAGTRSDITVLNNGLAAAIKLTTEEQKARIESAATTFLSSERTLFQFIIRAGTPAAATLATELQDLTISQKSVLKISTVTVVTTTAAPVVTSEESDTLQMILIIAGGAAGGALLALVIAAIFCKPRATEAEERRMREKQEETCAKAQAEMQVQQLVRSGAFQRLQDRVIGLEKEESVRKAVDEVEEYQTKNKNIAKTVARQLLDEPFIEPQDRQIDRETKEMDSKQSKLSDKERRKQKAIDIVENAPWWHNAALQAEITADLARPRYAGLAQDEEDDDLFDDEFTGNGKHNVHFNAATINKRRAEAAKQKRQIAKIPDHLIDYSAVKVIAEGHHWLSFNQLPKCNPTIESQIMLAKSNLHGVGVFARRFIDRGTLLFTWANPSQINSSKHIYTANEMRFHFGSNWDARLHFVARDPINKKYCVAEDPKERGWGCCINSCRGTGGGLVSNVECVFPDQKGAGVIPWVRVTQTIAPLGELLLDYPFPELIMKQRGLNPNEFDEPPPIYEEQQQLSSTYGSSVPLSNPRPKQSLELPPPPPPPADTPQQRSLDREVLPPPPQHHQQQAPTTRNNSNDDDDDDGMFTLDVEPLTRDDTITGSPRTKTRGETEEESGMVLSPPSTQVRQQMQAQPMKEKLSEPPTETLTDIIKKRAIEGLDI